MNLKEYYKEILNNLLMTEVTASPKGQPVEPGSLRAKRLAGLQQGFHRLKDTGRQLRRKERIESILKAKGADTIGGLNVYGFADRQAGARLSNLIRYGMPTSWHRTPEQIQDKNNAARFYQRSKRGGDD